MVGKYCWRVVVLLCSMLLVQTVAASDMHITLERTTVELGHPIWLTITSDQTAVSLNRLDFTPWQGKVVLPRSYDVNLIDNNQRQSLRLRVYPMHKGQLTLPGLHFLYHTTAPLTIQVIAAQDPKQHSPIDFEYHISTNKPWQQQQVIVACTITMQDHYAVFTQPLLDRRSDLQVLPMQVQHQLHSQAGRRHTVYKLGWIVTPTLAGKRHLQLPPIQYVRDGVVSHRFYVPPLTLAVQARPAWLPGTIPVGKVRVIHYGIAGSWLNSDVLAHVHLQLQLDGMQSDMIPAYALQLHSDRQLRFYAAQRQLQTVIDHAGIQHRLTDDIPVVAKHIGMYRLPPLRVQYFDPASGTLKTSTVPGPSVIVLNGWIKGALLLLLAALLLWLLRVTLRYLARAWRRYQTYQLALRQLQQTDSLFALKLAMQTMAQAEGWSRNLTYRQWQTRMQGVTPLAQQLVTEKLNAAGYGQAELDMTPVVQMLMRIGRQRRFALR